jgi:sulfotransferase family protein
LFLSTSSRACGVDWPSCNGPGSARALRLDYRHYETDCEGITIELIGAGLPRTGTLTQKLALEQLGVGPTYHWVNIIADLDQVELWHRALDGEDVLGEIFDGYESTVDWPGGFVYRQLAEANPEAKVLLSVRDPETWEPSYRDTIGAFCKGDGLLRHLSDSRREIDPRWRRYLELVDRMLWDEHSPFADGWEPEQMKQQMVAYNESVKAAIPAERLLVWQVSEGWEPLCAFLDVPVPSEPLPHENDRDTFVGRVTDGAIDALNAWRDARATATAAAAVT